MENRRPPRGNSSGRKPFADRERSSSAFSTRRPSGGGPGRQPRRTDSPMNVSRDDRGGRTTDPHRRDSPPGGYYRKDGNRFDPGRSDRRTTDGRSRIRGLKSDRPEIEIKITSDAQITDGRLRGKSLASSVSPHSVHTSRQLREAAFRIISRRVKAARFLDLGAGVGTIGIEAISRGAMLATFVERSARMSTLLRRNLTELGVKDGHGEVAEMEILPFLIRAGRKKRSWEIIYLGVSDADQSKAILDYLGRGTTTSPKGLVLLEHKAADSCPELVRNLKRLRTVNQGEINLSIYERI